MQDYLLTALILLSVIGVVARVGYGLLPGARETHYRVIA